MSMGAVAVRHDASSAAVVRRAIADDLAGHAVSRDSIDDVILVASELVGNAVLHGGTVGEGQDSPVDVGWEIERRHVVLRVGDGSSVVPRPRALTVDANCGRGLAIVAAIAADWGVDRTSHGKHVWARIPITAV